MPLNAKENLLAEWTGLEPATPRVTGPIFICLFGVFNTFPYSCRS